MVDPVGLSNQEIGERTQNVVAAWNRAQGAYVMNAIVAHTSQGLLGLLAGAIAMILGAAVLVIVGNVGGAALGGALGALAGGAGAAPGAALGRTIGNFVVMKFLEYLGVALLLTFIAEEVGVIGYHFMVGIDTAWNAPSGGRFRDIAIDFAARNGRSLNGMQGEHQRAQEWSTRVFGEDGQLAPLPNRFNLIHIPLLP